MNGRQTINAQIARELGLEIRRVFMLIARDIEIEVDPMEIRVRVVPSMNLVLPDGPLKITLPHHAPHPYVERLETTDPDTP